MRSVQCFLSVKKSNLKLSISVHSNYKLLHKSDKVVAHIFYKGIIFYFSDKMSSAGKFFHRNAQILIGIGTGAVFGASIIPHTLGLSKYRTFLAQHNEGKEEPITDKINKLTDNVSMHSS